MPIPNTMSLHPHRLTCYSFSDIDDALEAVVQGRYGRWIFRGHRNASWRLQPRLERFCPTMSEMGGVESAMITEFMAKAHLYADHLPISDSDGWDGWRSMMQHHGVPTRLLDWSYSPYVALFFAAEQRPDDAEAALWGIDWKAVDKVGGDILSGKVISPAETGLVQVITPRIHVSRLASQQGCFLSAATSPVSFEDSLEAMMDVGKQPHKHWLCKIVFPSSLRVSILRRLIHLNIHPATLFPDLEGLARFVTLKNELRLAPPDRDYPDDEHYPL